MHEFNQIFNYLKKGIYRVARNSRSLHDPSFNKLENKYLKNCINSTMVSTAGHHRKIFEKKLKKYTKVKYCLALNSGTEALHISLLAAGIKKEDEVLVPSLTFAGTVNAISYCGAVPHFIDVKNEDILIDCEKLDSYLKKITFRQNRYSYNKNTKRKISAIVIVHLFGRNSEIEYIRKIAKKYNILVIEDAAEALGSKLNNKMLGTFGDVGIFSFNGNKIITTGAGGALVTNKKKIYKLAFKLSNTGKKKHKVKLIHDTIGYNSLMSSLNASLGIAQLSKINFFLKRKRELYKMYNEVFKNNKYFTLYSENKFEKSNYWMQCIILTKKFSKYIFKLINKLSDNNIATRPIWEPIHMLKPYNICPKMNLSNTENIYKRIITLPSGVLTNSK